jgi:hypothetical protein
MRPYSPSACVHVMQITFELLYRRYSGLPAGRVSAPTAVALLARRRQVLPRNRSPGPSGRGFRLGRKPALSTYNKSTKPKPGMARPFRTHRQSVYFDTRAASGTAVVSPINGSVGAVGGRAFRNSI